jgi:hypothetical protein
MEKSTISMAIFNSFLYVKQRVHEETVQFLISDKTAAPGSRAEDSLYLQFMALNSYIINGITAPVTKVNIMLYISL